jgi:hypothetical protein
LAGNSKSGSALAIGVGHDAQWLLGLPVFHICIPRPYFANGTRVDEEILKADELPLAALAFSRKETMNMVPRDCYDISLGHEVGCNELIELPFPRAGVLYAVRVGRIGFRAHQAWREGSELSFNGK